jgi:hypothetical protein
MLLSNYLLSGGVKPYLEYGWVTAPNASGQSITDNTITTLTINTEIADTGNNGSISGNQITLSSGTYYFEAYTHGYSGSNNNIAIILSLENITDSSTISKRGTNTGNSSVSGATEINGQFTISTSKTFELRAICVASMVISSNTYITPLYTLSTAGADQRTTIKLWKLA